MSKKCCKSYKKDKACKKCPLLRDWYHLMNWNQVQPELYHRRTGDWSKRSPAVGEIQLRESCPVGPLSILEPV